MTDPVPIVPAATVVLLREGRDAPEVLLLRRNSRLAFHGGAWVFPGGRIEEGDGPATRVRGTRRFATWFYVTEAGRDEVRIDGGEIHEHRWFSIPEALAAQRAKEIELPPPTFVTLALLAEHRSPGAVLSATAARQPTVYVPRIVRCADGMASLYPGDAGWRYLHEL